MLLFLIQIKDFPTLCCKTRQPMELQMKISRQFFCNTELIINVSNTCNDLYILCLVQITTCMIYPKLNLKSFTCISTG